MLEVRIPASKMDPFRKGVKVYTGKLCPVAATLYYMVQRGSGSGPLFLFYNGKYLTRERFVAAVREALRMAGLDSSCYPSWGSNDSCSARSPGLTHPDPRTLGECSLYGVHQNSTLCGVARTLVG